MAQFVGCVATHLLLCPPNCCVGKLVKSSSGGTTTYTINQYYQVDQPDTLSLSVQNNSNTGNSFTYRTFDNTTTYTIQAGDHLEFDEFLDANNPVNNGGLDAVLSTSGTVRDTSGWVDQNGYSIHPATVLPANDKGVWYSRSFDMTNKAGQTLSTFKIACEGDVAGYYVILLKNIRITHNGVDVKDIYQGGFPSANLQAEGPTSGIAFQTTSRGHRHKDASVRGRFPAGRERDSRH